MKAHVDHHPAPPMHAPVMLVCLDGWVDAGRTAERLARALTSRPSVLVAAFDVDELVDFRNRRPTMRVVDGVNTGIDWPSIEILATHDLDGRDVLVLRGPEPDRGWRGFAAAVVEVARRVGTRMVLSLGAYPAATAHTRPVDLSAIGTTPALVHQVGYLEGRLEVPAGVQAAIERACADSGIPCAGLWAPVPHYVSAESFPAATVALLQGLEQVADRRFCTPALEHEADQVLRRLDVVVRADADRAALVADLESHSEVVSRGHPADLPSGDELAAQLERYLEDGDD